MKVLYIHHAGPFGGASRSLLELLRAIPENQVSKYVVTKKGQFASILEKEGISVIKSVGVSQFDNTRYSYYRGLRWLIILRELIYLPTTLFSLLKARKKWGRFDLVHVNDITLVPSIFFSKVIFRCPVIVHVRSVQQPLCNFRGKLLKKIIKKNVSSFIAIDKTVAQSLDIQFPVSIIHNGFNFSRKKIEKNKSKKIFTVGMVGSLSKAKGCLDFIEAAKLCKKAGAKIRFVFVGQSTRPKNLIRDNVLKFFGISQEIEGELKKRIYEYDLSENIEFWPFTLNLENVYQELDLVCFPSHFNAPGRPIFEAAFFGIPSVATISSPTSDTFIDNKTGLLINPGDIHGISESILKFYKDRRFLLSTGRSANNLANRYYDINKNGQKVLNLYKLLIKK
jgi:glycosyltransferase involved in cell wall biosynthesis